MKHLKKILIESQREHFNVANDFLLNHRNLSNWELTSFSIGIGVEGEAGIGPWNLGLAVKQRLIFKRNK